MLSGPGEDWAKYDWETIIRILLIYTASKMRNRTWHGVWTEQFDGTSPEDVVSTVIEKSIRGQRKWNKSRYPRIEYFLASCIDSEIYHLINSPRNEFIHHYIDDEESNLEIADDISIELSVLRKVNLERFLDELKIYDVDVHSLAKLMLIYGISGNKELSDQTEFSIQYILNLKKRLKRFSERFSLEPHEQREKEDDYGKT